MKNLNFEKAIMPSAKTANFKFICCLCAVLCFLTSALSTQAQDRTGTGTYNDPYEFEWDVTTFPGSTYYQNSFYNDQSNLTNNWGASNSGNDCWIKITVPTAATLTVFSGTTSGYDPFDDAIHLVDSTRSYDLAYGDDNPSHGAYPLSGNITYTVGPGVYYVVLDGTDKPDVYPNPNHIRNGGVGITFTLE